MQRNGQISNNALILLKARLTESVIRSALVRSSFLPVSSHMNEDTGRSLARGERKLGSAKKEGASVRKRTYLRS